MSVVGEMLAGQGLELSPPRGAQGALIREDVGHRTVGRRPRAEGGDELVPADQAVVKREQAEQQVAGRISAAWNRRGSQPRRRTSGPLPLL
jgi:hypothetical protein